MISLTVLALEGGDSYTSLLFKAPTEKDKPAHREFPDNRSQIDSFSEKQTGIRVSEMNVSSFI